MRITTLLLLTAMLSFKVYADVGDVNVTKFEGVQENCAQVGEISFGPNGRWSSCHVTRGRWVATIDYIDLYQAQYCLGKNMESCDQRAMVIFGNRAYTANAKALLVHIDDATTSYDDPLVVISGDERIMSLSAHNAAGATVNTYYIWRADHWAAMDARSWLQNLAEKLPSGISARQGGWPDLETMSANLDLYQSGDADCCPTGGMANVELSVAKDQFSIKQIHTDKNSKYSLNSR